MSAALLIDFGSTYTKLRAVDLERCALLGSGQGPSTVQTDVRVGMRLALEDLVRRIGRAPAFKYRLASSSAAGGLRMVTVGLVRELTAEAARRSALGAGAKLVGTFAYRLNSQDVERIMALAPDILLLAGGTDGGNVDVVRHNAAALASSALQCPVIYAGNRDAVDDVRRLLAGKSLRISENVMPEFNVLDIEPARAAIRQVFIERIVHAKGIDRAADEFDAVLMPTPAAVMEGARLLADGHGSVAGLGELVVIDPGGATTDVHSVAKGEPSVPGAVQRGLPEPRVKRTVEGDLGMRHNAAAIEEAAGLDAIARDAGLAREQAAAIIAALGHDVARLPATREERAVDLALARTAVTIAMRRHCGSTQVVQTVHGPVTVQEGKDLTAVRALVGTGGVFAHGDSPGVLLRSALADSTEPFSLRPRSPRLLLDAHYVLYACGLLAQAEPAAALELALKHLSEVPEEAIHERKLRC